MPSSSTWWTSLGCFSVFIGVAEIITLPIGAVGIANYHLATLSERSVEIVVSRTIGATIGP